MYAKVLLPSDPPTAMLICTVDPQTPLLSQLRAQGWTQDTDISLTNEHANLHITSESLVLTVSGKEVLRDYNNPVAPAGWWKAVSENGDRVIIAFVPDGFDLDEQNIASHLNNAADDDRTAWGYVPLTT